VAGSSGVLSFFQVRETFMSTYFKKGKGWRYDFTQQGTRHTEAWFKTKKEAKEAEAKKREELKNPPATVETPTDMAFLELVNYYLDHAKRKFAEKTYKYKVYVFQATADQRKSLSFPGENAGAEISTARQRRCLR
jgi:hypothetical protein